ncbi:unnamed protein product, partial [Effrenium voratum]
ARRWRQALALLAQHPRPSLVTLNAALSALGTRWQQALALAGAMAGGRLALDHVTSAALVASCSGASAVQAALELAMSVTSGTPRGMSLNSALRACAARRAWRAAVATFRAARRAHADDALGLAALLSALEGR